jgi:hypothetical protein
MGKDVHLPTWTLSTSAHPREKYDKRSKMQAHITRAIPHVNHVHTATRLSQARISSLTAELALSKHIVTAHFHNKPITYLALYTIAKTAWKKVYTSSTNGGKALPCTSPKVAQIKPIVLPSIHGPPW